MKIEAMDITVIDRKDLVARVRELAKGESRLVVVTCTGGAGAFEVTYSFDRDYAQTHLRVSVPRNEPTLPSITDIYLCAFTYENELQDLFGIKMEGLRLNFEGKFYRKSKNMPFADAGSAEAK